MELSFFLCNVCSDINVFNLDLSVAAKLPDDLSSLSLKAFVYHISIVMHEFHTYSLMLLVSSSQSPDFVHCSIQWFLPQWDIPYPIQHSVLPVNGHLGLSIPAQLSLADLLFSVTSLYLSVHMFLVSWWSLPLRHSTGFTPLPATAAVWCCFCDTSRCHCRQASAVSH